MNSVLSVVADWGLGPFGAKAWEARRVGAWLTSAQATLDLKGSFAEMVGEPNQVAIDVVDGVIDLECSLAGEVTGPIGVHKAVFGHYLSLQVEAS
jgi:hypothetical protein